MTIFNGNKKGIAKQTYTYFIPSPPERSTPYQEKAFDLITQFLNKNNIEFNISHTAVNEKGVWVFLELFGKEALLNKIINEMQNKVTDKINTSSDEHDLELYYEDHEEFHKDDNFKA